ncbi:flagellar hook assembly protein FlgD [Photobacterium swingsii]|uniref:Basal-body rod modification protein FlgD n=1 Tax=Photobacterium swingsii TaxID=680026 RepID=A0A0J8V8Z6_9GAMM|nr:flagellar hook assembly protein FlgD [Photobacterium swingsii]KMV29686.1 flagellar basal body rod modification protein FlgD [Photobacterium swingsii]PSW26557.1 flagellar hook assembly protein FlgD [Photobacterium swingsii]
MTGINGAGGASNLTYLDQLKSMQDKKVQEEQKTTGQNELKQEDFLSLLTKQLAQQDPFKPVGNDQMIAQMASFATVDGISQMNDQFGSLNSAMTSSQALQASSLVGRDVLIPSATAVKGIEGGVAGMVKLPQALDNLMVRIENEQGQLIKTMDLGAKPPGEHRLDWDGMDENGNPLPEGRYQVKAAGLVGGENREFDVSTYANVNSVLLGNGDGNVMLNLAGLDSPFKLAEVLEVGQV